MYIVGWDRIVVPERRNGNVIWEDDYGAHERLAFDGDRLYVIYGSPRAPDDATGEERWRYGSEETISATDIVDGAVYVGTGRGDLVALSRTDDGGLFGDRERWLTSLSRNVGHSLATTNRRVFCPLVRDDGLPSMAIAADADESSVGTTAGANGSES